MKILVACEESQVVCIAFRDKGHEAYSCDVQYCSGGHPEWHIMCDVLSLINGNCSFFTCDGKLHNIVGEWDMIIAHPPCTYISKAGACRMYPKAGIIDPDRFELAMDAKAFFMTIYECNCSKIVIENPVPLKCVGLPIYTQKIQPYEYDIFNVHPYTKATLLWLKGVPMLQATTPLNKPIGTYIDSNCSNFAKGHGGCRGIAHSSKDRSKTFIGIAACMADTWG